MQQRHETDLLKPLPFLVHNRVKELTIWILVVEQLLVDENGRDFPALFQRSQNAKPRARPQVRANLRVALRRLQALQGVDCRDVYGCTLQVNGQCVKKIPGFE